MNHKQIPKGFLRFIVIPNFLKAANAFGAANAGKNFIRDDSSGFVKTSNESAPLFSHDSIWSEMTQKLFQSLTLKRLLHSS